MAKIGRFDYGEHSRSFSISIEWAPEDNGVSFRMEIYAYTVVDKSNKTEDWDLIDRIDDLEGGNGNLNTLIDNPYNFPEAFPPKHFFEAHYKAELYKCVDTCVGEPVII